MGEELTTNVDTDEHVYLKNIIFIGSVKKRKNKLGYSYNSFDVQKSEVASLSPFTF